MLRSVYLTAFSKNKIDSSKSSGFTLTLLVAGAVISLLPSASRGQEVEAVNPPAVEQKNEQAKVEPEEKPEAMVKLKKLTVDFRGKELAFEAPENWKAKKPRFNFTKHELMLPKAEGEEKDARLTFTLSSGSTQDNLDRWKSQFKFPTGANPDKVFSVEKKTVDGYELSLVQIRGTFMETMGGGPFAGGKKIPRENYMMKAVIISPKDANSKTAKCFIKLVGSEKTLKQHAKAYAAMVKSMKTQMAVE